MELVGHLFACCNTGTLSLAHLECHTQSQYTPDTNRMMPTPLETAAIVPIFKTLVCLDRDSNPRTTSPQADALTTRPRGLVIYLHVMRNNILQCNTNFGRSLTLIYTVIIFHLNERRSMIKKTSYIFYKLIYQYKFKSQMLKMCYILKHTDIH